MAERCCGLHAQVVGWADLQIRARTRRSYRGAVAKALWDERSVVRTWCMRGTLHLLTPAQLAVYTSLFEPGWHHSPAWLQMARLTATEADDLLLRLEDALAGGRPLSRRELSRATGREFGSWGTLFGPAARVGILVQGPPRGAETTFVRTEEWLGAKLPRLDPSDAGADWLRRYLRAYGPASRADYRQWLGGRTVTAVAEAYARLGPELAEVQVQGRRLYCLASDLAELEGDRGGPLPVRLLPGFDPLIMGHLDRAHLAVPAAMRDRVYRQAAWVSATVLVGGRVRGTWAHRRRRDRLAVEVRPFAPLGAAARRGVEVEARALARHFEMDLDLSYTY
ncbi:MAG: winged helix DNA-binding domain-containing protein [Candidatus Dormibacteraeota bacterium]|nr:winged helix DNA-binding domain-containing protein [Candidatus Dormibacteraeota bacterium]